MAIDQRLLRLALAIHADLNVSGSTAIQHELPSREWERCLQTSHRIRRASHHNWHLAAARLQDDLAYELSVLRSELGALTARLPQVPVSRVVPIREIYQDLVALASEFPAVDFEMSEQRLSVTTPEVTLENVPLGAFEIRWHWQRSASPNYRVIALDPHAAAERENVTHPHVMDEQLCEGDSHVAIREAANQGRLLDFFTLVASGLRSYNPDSPFVALEDWFGARCSDCGYSTGSDDGYTCEKCSESICSDCEASCRGCDYSYCSRCVATCRGCENGYCRDCLTACSECHQRFCSGCIVEKERCSDCHEEYSQAEAAEADAPVQPDSLGEAALSA